MSFLNDVAQPDPQRETTASSRSGVTAFNPSDYLLAEFEQLCSRLASMTTLERQQWFRPALRRLNAWERSTLIGALRFLISSFPKDAHEQREEA